MKDKLLLVNPDGLVGDFLGTIPVMTDLSKIYDLSVQIHPEAQGLFDLIRHKYQITQHSTNQNSPFLRIELNIGRAFSDSFTNKWYMSQAYHSQVGLETPKIAPKADLQYEKEDLQPYIFDVDWYISPFARSLPPNHRPSEKFWQTIIDLNPTKRFGILGNSKYDPKNILTGDNVIQVYNTPFNYLCGQLKKAEGLVSVVTGTSHLAFHLGVKNILLTNQDMTWGNNPDAIKITKPIQTIKPEEISEYINN